MLPEGWKEKTIGACAEIGRGFAFKSEQYVVSGFPVLRVGNIENNGKISTMGEWKYIPARDVSKYRNYLVRKDDIILVMVGATAGKIGVIQECSGKYLLNQNMWILRSREDGGLEQRYFSYIVRDLVGRFLETLQGSARAFFRQSDFLQSTLVLPPLPEQKKIATILSTWDRAIEVTEKLLANSQQQKKALMQQLLTGKKRLPGFTGEWRTTRLMECCECLDNFRIPLNADERQTMKGSIPYWGANGVVDFVDRHLFDETIILIAEDGGNFSEYRERPIAQISHGKAWVNNHAHVLRASKNKVEGEWVYFCLVHKDITPFVNGGTRAKLNKEHMLKIEIPLPSLREQNAITFVLIKADEEITLLKSDLSHLRQEKKALMQQLLTGKRRVKTEADAG